MEWARKPSAKIKENTTLTWHVGFLEHKMALQGPELKRKHEEKVEQTEYSHTGAFQVDTVAVYGEHPTSKIQIATGTSSWFEAWQHS